MEPEETFSAPVPAGKLFNSVIVRRVSVAVLTELAGFHPVFLQKVPGVHQKCVNASAIAVPALWLDIPAGSSVHDIGTSVVRRLDYADDIFEPERAVYDLESRNRNSAGRVVHGYFRGPAVA